jgi:hypothetical protein
MKSWTDYSPYEQRQLPAHTQMRLLRAHLVSWIRYWGVQQDFDPNRFIKQLDQLCLLNRRKP